jgi:hypothetical protein
VLIPWPFADRIDRHEHLYEKIRVNVVESAMFPDDVVLSMLSNDKLSQFTRLVPLEVVIVDEASQIEIGDYLPMLSRFQTTLRKVVFIGDDKQCSYLCFICPGLPDSHHACCFSGSIWPRRHW